MNATMTDACGRSITIEGWAAMIERPEDMATDLQREAHTPGPGRLVVGGAAFLSLDWPPLEPPIRIEVQGALVGTARSVDAFADRVFVNLIEQVAPLSESAKPRRGYDLMLLRENR